MICGAEWFFEASGAIFANRQQTIRQTDGSFAPHSIEALANRLCDSRRHALSGEPRELLSQSVGLFALDVQAHHLYHSTLHSNHSTIFESVGKPRLTRIRALGDVKLRLCHNRVTAAGHRGGLP